MPDIIVVRYWLPFMGPCLGTILRIAKKNRHTKWFALQIISFRMKNGREILFLQNIL